MKYNASKIDMQAIDEYMAAVDDLMTALDKNGIQQRAKEEVLYIFYSLRPDVVRV